MLGPIRGQLAEDAGCFPRRCRTPIESSRRTPPLGRLTRQSPEILVQSPKTSRCHPGCISPDVQESIEATFCRLPAKTQQAVLSPRHRAWDAIAESHGYKRGEIATPSRSGATTALPEVDEAQKAAQIYCKELLALPEELRKAAQDYCKQLLAQHEVIDSPRDDADSDLDTRSASPEVREARKAAQRFCKQLVALPEAQKAAQVYCKQLVALPEETRKAAQLYCKQLLALPEDLRKAAQMYCKQLLSQREVTPTPDPQAFARLPKALKEALKVLGRPHAYWPSELCKEVRAQAAKRYGSEEAALLHKLQLCVKLATDFVFKRGFYEVEDHDVRRKLLMMDVLSPSLKVRWFDYSNSRIPETKVDIGKAVPPPLIVTDASCLDVVERLRSLELTASHEIFVVTELLDFDAEGGFRSGVCSQRPHCMTLRADLQRFAYFAAKHMKRKKLSLQSVLCDWKLPSVFLASDLTCFRGSQGDGYPFSLRPFQFHTIGMALWTPRPRLRTERDYQGERMTMYCDSDDAKAYEVRLELCAHAALLAAGGVHLPKEEKPVLVLPVIGLGGSSFHPQDAVVLALKSFRRRFTQFFHSIYVCCGDRGPNYSLSDFIESAVNRSAYMMALNDSLAAKALPWHWDQREIEMSIAASRLEKIGHHMRQGPAYVVKIKDDRRTAERKQIVEKTEVHYGFGTLRAYHHRKKLEAADELIKAQRREGNWPADMVHIKLGGLRDNLELSPEFEDVELSDFEVRRRKSQQVQMSVSRINMEMETSPPTSPLSKDLGALQELMLSVRSSSKTKSFSGWLKKADAVTQQMGSGGQVLLHAKRRSGRKESTSVEAAVASEDVRVDTFRL